MTQTKRAGDSAIYDSRGRTRPLRHARLAPVDTVEMRPLRELCRIVAHLERVEAGEELPWDSGEGDGYSGMLVTGVGALLANISNAVRHRVLGDFKLVGPE